MGRNGPSDCEASTVICMGVCALANTAAAATKRSFRSLKCEQRIRFDGAFATIADVIQYRRLAALVLGAWLGAGVFADFAVVQNFATADRFLAAPGNILAATELAKIGRERERVMLRRNAGEENNFIFLNWERAELAIGAVLLGLLAFGGRPDKFTLGLTLAMLSIVAGQHFFLTPQVTDLGRRIADLPPNDPLNATFWLYHGVYSGVEILKLLLGGGLALRLSLRRAEKQHG